MSEPTIDKPEVPEMAGVSEARYEAIIAEVAAVESDPDPRRLPADADLVVALAKRLEAIHQAPGTGAHLSLWEARCLAAEGPVADLRTALEQINAERERLYELMQAVTEKNVALTNERDALAARLRALGEPAVEWAIRVPADDEGEEELVCFPDDHDDALQYLARYRDCWPHAHLVQRTVSRGPWTPASGEGPDRG